jgi:phosphatidylglycerophosphatase C
MNPNRSQDNVFKKKIAFFDFDGTITTKDSLLEFIKYAKGKWSFYLGFLLHSPYLIAYKLKIISNHRAKEKVLQFFFKDMPLEKFVSLCEGFSAEVLPDLIRPKAIEEIKRFSESGVHVIIVSASPENWILPWARMMHAELLATCLEVKDGKITGKIQGNNCHGLEKIRRIKCAFNLSDYDEIYAYGDSRGDEPMLALASHPFMKPFR